MFLLPQPVSLKQRPSFCLCLSSSYSLSNQTQKPQKYVSNLNKAIRSPQSSALFQRFSLSSQPVYVAILYTPLNRCDCLPAFTPTRHDTFHSKSQMSSETVNTASQEETHEDAIPSHHALGLNGTALSLTFDFNLYPSSFWTGEAFIPYRSTLLTTLPQYFSPHQRITKLQISILFPHHRTQSNTLRITQRDLVNRVTAIVRTSEGVEVEVIFQSPETDWSQVRCLAPFWGLKGQKWRVRV
jgi:hypothetical protein